MLSVESQTLSRKGVDLWRPRHNCHGAANVPRINRESSLKKSNSDRGDRIPIIPHVIIMSVCSWNWSKQIPHPTEECSFEFWIRCHMEPVNEIHSFNHSFHSIDIYIYIIHNLPRFHKRIVQKLQKNAQIICSSKSAPRHFLWLLASWSTTVPTHEVHWGLPVITSGRYAEHACLRSGVLGCSHTWEEISMTKDPNLSRAAFISACPQPVTQFFYHKLLKPLNQTLNVLKWRQRPKKKQVCIYLPLQYKRVLGPTGLPGRIRRIWLTT